MNVSAVKSMAYVDKPPLCDTQYAIRNTKYNPNFVNLRKKMSILSAILSNSALYIIDIIGVFADYRNKKPYICVLNW